MLDQADDSAAIAALVNGLHGDPFALLGPHDTPDGVVIRTLQPGAREVLIFSRKTTHQIAKMTRLDDAGLFIATLNTLEPYYLQIQWDGDVQETEDPYSFPVLLSEFDLYLLAEGKHRDLATCLGAQILSIDDVTGVRFAVWAPNAQRVSVVGNFNGWDGRRHPMRFRQNAGIWELFIPRIGAGASYKYEIIGPHGLLPLKADPVARQTEVPPATASVVGNPVMASRLGAALRNTQSPGYDKPLAIYEVHAPSWMRHFNGKSYSWDELSERLIPYVKDLGFTHLELLPIMGPSVRADHGAINHSANLRLCQNWVLPRIFLDLSINVIRPASG